MKQEFQSTSRLAELAQVELESGFMKTNSATGRWLFAPLIFFAWIGALFTNAPRTAFGDDDEVPDRVFATARTLDGRPLQGQILGDKDQGFHFALEDGSTDVPLSELIQVDFNRSANASKFEEPPPPFLVDLGLNHRLSGQLLSMDRDSIRLRDGPGGQDLTIVRGGALAIRQRPGELLVLNEPFERLDRNRWRVVGRPEVVEVPQLEGGHLLRLPAGSASLTHRLKSAIGAGRLDLAFFQDENGKNHKGQRWFVDLLFDGPHGHEAVQILLGWGDEGPGVISRGGPELVIQPLTLAPGWQRLSVQFGTGRTLVAINGDELAHGRGQNGPLVEIRLATETTGRASPPDDLNASVDDLRLVRFAGPSSGLEIDITQDDVRLNQGDQLFGNVISADVDGLVLEVDDRRLLLSWNEVSGVAFRRVPETSKAIEGWLVKLSWQANSGRDLDQIDGALVQADNDGIVLETAYAGQLKIPRDRLQRLDLLGKRRRIVLDPYSHHLGDHINAELDPPYYEADYLDLEFELDEIPPGEPSLVLVVLDVEGEADGLRFSKEIQNGELRTNVSINGQEFDYINRHIVTGNKTPERIRLKIPEGILQEGSNRLRFDQVGTEDQPLKRDNLGLLNIALEFETAKAAQN